MSQRFTHFLIGHEMHCIADMRYKYTNIVQLLVKGSSSQCSLQENLGSVALAASPPEFCGASNSLRQMGGQGMSGHQNFGPMGQRPGQVTNAASLCKLLRLKTGVSLALQPMLGMASNIEFLRVPCWHFCDWSFWWCLSQTSDASP
jgi:hypothetical protein